MDLACILCGNSLTTETREAHALARSLGGRLWSRQTECSTCNAYLGTLEEQLFEALRPLSASLGAVTADGKEVSAVIDVPGEGRLRARRGQAERTTLARPTITVVGEKRIRYLTIPRNDRERVKVIARMIFDDGKNASDLDEGRVQVAFEPLNPARSVGLGEFSLRLNTRCHRRVFVKFAISTLACFDGGAARSAYLDDARRFVRNDLGDVDFHADPSTQGCGLLDQETTLASRHSVEAWSTQGRLVARVNFFGVLPFTAVLAPWPRAPVSVAYAADPFGVRAPVSAFAHSDGARLGIIHNGSASDALERAMAWFDETRDRVYAEARVTDAARPPNLDVLLPGIRAHLIKLWSKLGKDSSRRGRRRSSQ